jgi:hypothetical protein
MPGMSEFEAMLSLLSDQDPDVHDALSTRLCGDSQLLDRLWRFANEQGGIPETLTEIVLRMDAEMLVDAFADAEDLDSGVWILPRLHMPRRDFRSAGRASLDELANRLAPGAQGDAIARLLCGDCGFAGARRDYDDPLHSYLPMVLERRLGLPITLTVLWMLIGRRVGASCEAIALPGHVVGRWSGGYIDLFDAGRAISREELDACAANAGDASAKPYLAPASDRALLRRMARNLVHSYVRRNDTLRATIAHGFASS